MNGKPLASLVAVLATLPAAAADILITPPAAGGVSITDASGATSRLRVADDGTITMTGLRTSPSATSPVVIGGHSGNNATAGVAAAVIAGGGLAGTGDPVTGNGCASSCANRVTDHAGTVGGGVGNQAGDGAGGTDDRSYATVSGGIRNIASGGGSAVGGGHTNTASGDVSAVAGGLENVASAQYSVVGGGWSNDATGGGSAILGGAINAASADFAAVVGGYQNTASGDYSAVCGGFQSKASGTYSFAGGRRAKTETAGLVVHNGTFVWADSNNSDFRSTANNQFNVRSTGGARIVSAIDGSGNPTQGVSLAAGGGSWGSISDVHAKADFVAVDPRDVLERVAALPISSWRYRAQDASIRHIGPMAQDFHAAFGVGESDRMITTVDADGVALAAIQGLHRLVAERERHIGTLDARIAAQDERIADLQGKLEALIARLQGPSQGR